MFSINLEYCCTIEFCGTMSSSNITRFLYTANVIIRNALVTIGAHSMHNVFSLQIIFDVYLYVDKTWCF